MAENTSSTSKEVSQRNSSTGVIAAGSFFTGTWEDVSNFTSVTASANASENGIVYCEFSNDAINLREFKSYQTVAGVEESNTTAIPSGAVYYRTRLKNTGAVALPKGASVGINFTTPAGNTSMVVEFAIACYLEVEEGQ